MTVEELLAEARRLGLTVYIAHLEPDLLGYYEHRHSRIVMRAGLTEAEFRCTLAHELGHAYGGHECGGGPYERQASRRAAHLLVDRESYAAAELLNPDPGAIARELGLTRRVVEDFQTYLATASPRGRLTRR